MQHDILLKRYLSDNERFADLINGFGFGGKQVVTASDLVECDTEIGQHGIKGENSVKHGEKPYVVT